jgi:hypothetical protein
MLLTWILPTCLLAGGLSWGGMQSAKATPTMDKVVSTSVFIPEPNSPPVITQGSGTR